MLNFTHSEEKENDSYIEIPFFFYQAGKNSGLERYSVVSLQGKGTHSLLVEGKTVKAPTERGLQYLSSRKENAFTVFLSNPTSKNEM